MSEAMILDAVSGSCKTMVDNTLRITFDFEPNQASKAFALFGERGTPAAIALLTKDTAVNALRQTQIKKQKGDYGQYAQALYRQGFLIAPPVLIQLGSDKQYRQWIQTQKSVFSGDYSEWIQGEGRCIAAHVRRAGEAGTSFKPVYSCIPLTDSEHQLQHQQGESALLGLDWENEKHQYLVKWAKSRIYEIFSIESLTQLHPYKLLQWCENNGLVNYLPQIYREART